MEYLSGLIIRQCQCEFVTIKKDFPDHPRKTKDSLASFIPGSYIYFLFSFAVSQYSRVFLGVYPLALHQHYTGALSAQRFLV